MCGYFVTCKNLMFLQNITDYLQLSMTVHDTILKCLLKQTSNNIVLKRNISIGFHMTKTSTTLSDL